MSALATIVGGLGELSESELRQLYLMVGVRLGNPDGSPGVKRQGAAPGKTGNTKSSGGKASKKTAAKGNPSRKSQWANHPLYQEYSRLKKVVETQAKEAKTSFNAIDTPEGRAYRKAFTDWVEAKHSFRDHRTGGRKEGDDDEAESSEDEEEEVAKTSPAPSSGSAKQTLQAKPASAKPLSPAGGKSTAQRK